MQIPEIQEGKFNIAAVLIGPHDDGGWSQAHYEGLKYVEQNMPNAHIAYVENVPEGTESEQVIRSLARKGFDLIIVDECHRGSARDESNWREILEWFEPAYQLGMTATPLRDENRDTYLYFGNPVYTYSLKQGIDDGFLAPYRVHRIVTQWDAAGWRPR